MYMVLFYKFSHQDLCFDSVFSWLKPSLEATLSIWYPALKFLILEIFLSTMISLRFWFASHLLLITEMPLVVAQVTKFDCGGYAIGIGTSHSLFDGISAFDLKVKDVLSCINQCMKEGPWWWIRIRVVQTHIQHQLIIYELISCSSFELLAAHLWKVRTKALGLERERNVCLQFAVDARNRMVTLFPKGFSGNGYVLASVVSTAGELEEHCHEYIINQIKETKNCVTHNYVNAYIKALQGPQATLPSLPELTVVSDWTRVSFHRVDFLGEEATYASPLLPPIL
ncbi:hypothetical protein Pfo_010904 [Paulownia fortunei]|nr:hypothetical protein Pfo_010904 [Paulownia fortunei]